MKTRNACLPFALAALALAGCAAMAPSGPVAIAELMPTEGSSTSGTARFEQRGDKVLITAEVSGLSPGGEHGFHVHEKGDCSSDRYPKSRCLFIAEPLNRFS
jgi:Cu-Zn family superoxide dismutase